jgi:hypothetical protein
VRQYSCFSGTQTLTDLVDGRFFLSLLQSLPNFKLVSMVNEATGPCSLPAKIALMKNLTRSLIWYHQTQLLKDVS